MKSIGQKCWQVKKEHKTFWMQRAKPADMIAGVRGLRLSGRKALKYERKEHRDEQMEGDGEDRL